MIMQDPYKIKHGRLPNEFQEVEWIGPNYNSEAATACINTGLKWNEITSIKMNVSGNRNMLPTYYGRSGAMLLATYTGTTRRSTPFVGLSDSGIFSSSVTVNMSPSYTRTDYLARFIEFTLTISSSNTGIVEFGSWTDAPYWSVFSSKDLVFYNGTTELRHFVPCYRKSDNEIGMYDLITQSFYANAGTKTFVKGANV